MKTRQFLGLIGPTLILAGCFARSSVEVDPNDAGTGPCPPSAGGGIGFGGSTGFGPPALPPEPLVPAHTPPPISGGTLAVSDDGKLAVAADPDRDKVYVIDLRTLTKQTIALEPGSEPGRVAFDGAGRAHVALRSAAGLLQIDPATATILRQTVICDFPRGVTYRASDDAMLVACADGHLLQLGADDHAEQARTFLDVDLRDVVITKHKKVLVSRFRAADLLDVDGQGKERSRVSLAAAKALAPRIDPVCGTVGERTVTQAPRVAWRTTLDADGNALVLHQRSRVEVVETSQPGGYSGDGCANVSEVTISKVSVDGKQTASVPLFGATLAVDLAASPNGRWIALASAGNTLLSFNASLQLYSSSEVTRPGSTLSEPESSEPAPPAGPCSLAVPVTSDLLGDQTTAAGQATAVRFDSAGRLLVQTREPARLLIFSVAENVDVGGGAIVPAQLTLQNAIRLDDQSVRDTGHDFFHSDVGGGIACASCHPEGRDDGHAWNFESIGLRRTQNMSGGLKGSEPFHWDGDMANFQHLVDEVMTSRMGGFGVEPLFANALLGWIDKLPALKLSTDKKAAVERGKVLFQSSQCGSCHSGPMLTNRASTDVGTGGTFQVPSLVGLGLRGPFMHDGCAQDLIGRFDEKCGGGDLHGKTSGLTKKEIADLATYLSTL